MNTNVLQGRVSGSGVHHREHPRRSSRGTPERIACLQAVTSTGDPHAVRKDRCSNRLTTCAPSATAEIVDLDFSGTTESAQRGKLQWSMMSQNPLCCATKGARCTDAGAA